MSTVYYSQVYYPFDPTHSIQLTPSAYYYPDDDLRYSELGWGDVKKVYAKAKNLASYVGEVAYNAAVEMNNTGTLQEDIIANLIFFRQKLEAKYSTKLQGFNNLNVSHCVYSTEYKFVQGEKMLGDYVVEDINEALQICKKFLTMYEKYISKKGIRDANNNAGYIVDKINRFQSNSAKDGQNWDYFIHNTQALNTFFHELDKFLDRPFLDYSATSLMPQKDMQQNPSGKLIAKQMIQRSDDRAIMLEKKNSKAILAMLHPPMNLDFVASETEVQNIVQDLSHQPIQNRGFGYARRKDAEERYAAQNIPEINNDDSRKDAQNFGYAHNLYGLNNNGIEHLHQHQKIPTAIVQDLSHQAIQNQGFG